jgi:transposase
VYLEVDLRRVDCRVCGAVRREGLAWLLDSPFCSTRFGDVIGAKCRTQTIHDVAREHMLDWHTVKELDRRYMAAQLTKAGTPAPRVIGIDEISIKKRHTYRIIVSDLERRRAIWFGGADRSEASMDQFFVFLGEKASKKIDVAVMDMWKPFRHSTTRHAPQAAVLFDKFHILRHLGEALDTVRKHEYARLTGRDRRFIKGQKYALLSHRANLTTEARAGLKTLLAANKRLNTAYLLKESFGLPPRGLGPALLRELDTAAQVAAAQAVRAVRSDDRCALGRDRGLLCGGEQGGLGLRRGPEQQDPGDPAPCLRATRRRVPPLEGAHVHASGTLKS